MINSYACGVTDDTAGGGNTSDRGTSASDRAVDRSINIYAYSNSTVIH